MWHNLGTDCRMRSPPFRSLNRQTSTDEIALGSQGYLIRVFLDMHRPSKHPPYFLALRPFPFFSTARMTTPSSLRLSFHLYTLYLFTKSDMKTLIPPVTLFAAAAAPSCSLSRLLHTVLWLWVHTLQLGLANQTLPRALAEDVINHPDRPLPAGRITVQQARTLRWMMIPLCHLLSAAYGPRTLLTSFGVSLFILAYNEGGGAGSHWLVRNAMNAIGYALAEAGATLVACRSESEADSIVWSAVALSAGIILTTIHTQDYKDVPGDIAAGRVTLPIAYPTLSRAITAFFLIAWSWGVSRTWCLDDVAASVMGVLALGIGISFVAQTDSRADKVSFYWYNVWLGGAYLLPGYYRLRLT